MNSVCAVPGCTIIGVGGDAPPVCEETTCPGRAPAKADETTKFAEAYTKARYAFCSYRDEWRHSKALDQHFPRWDEAWAATTAALRAFEKALKGG